MTRNCFTEGRKVMRTNTNYFKTPPIQADDFRKIVEGFCCENKLSECKVSVRKEVLFFSGIKTYFPVLWDFSFEGTFSSHDTYALISFEFSNVFDRVYNVLLFLIWVLILFLIALNMSTAVWMQAYWAFWFIVTVLESRSFFLQKRLLNICIHKIPGTTKSIKKKEFNKILDDN